ncbi:hypothetical protein [Rhodopseudomonas sp. P2A-2r]|uniref:hypothetical protein n=1 Tax=unclassified Rhodopseudomonas TaxID=2638247 RepID=UPI002234B061|nr:hypothetical protein [Rhodopseudomonas sp. P2A-2r]UZE50184.1 hypothetical protein ONR75_05400 [Rhodopseudomonas sp. P2A-2r]
MKKFSDCKGQMPRQGLFAGWVMVLRSFQLGAAGEGRLQNFERPVPHENARLQAVNAMRRFDRKAFRSRSIGSVVNAAVEASM